MATINNRSRFIVQVKNRDDLTQEFPYNQKSRVQAYLTQLRAEGYKPKVARKDDTFEVRVRQTGYPEQAMSMNTLAEAEAFVQKIKEERSRGLFTNYTKSHKITAAELLVRYLRKESPKRKSFTFEMYKIEGWLEDSGPRGKELLERYRDELRSEGKSVRPAKHKMRAIASNVSWLHKRFTEVTPEDIDDFVQDRLQDVLPSTVDRELDVFKSFFKVATTVWGYHLANNPMNAILGLKYFNERDRRLVGDEEERLMAAMEKLDRMYSIENRLNELVNQEMEGVTFTSGSARKKVMAEARKRLLLTAAKTYVLVPYLQVFVQFQLMTAARRGETLSLTRSQIDFVAQTAFLPKTKNGRARKLPLRTDIITLIRELPRNSESLFPIGVSLLTKAWKRACLLAGIDDLRIHDLRHEGISRVAELGGNKFSMLDLQLFSGHRDPRMLMRYAHLCASKMAGKLDEAFNAEKHVRIHKGRKLLNKQAREDGISVSSAIDASIEQAMADENQPIVEATPSEIVSMSSR